MWEKLKAWARSRNGKLVLGGTAVGGVVVAGLVARSKAGGDAEPAGGGISTAPPFGIATGTSGANADAFPSINAPGIDVGQFEQMLTELGRLSDAWEERNNRQPPTTNPAPAPKVPAGEIWYTVKAGDTLASINRRLYGHTDSRGLQDANRAVLTDGLKPGTVLVVPKAGRLA